LGIQIGNRLGLAWRLPPGLASLVASILCFGAGLPLAFVALGLPAGPSPIPGVLISIAGGFIMGSADLPLHRRRTPWRQRPAPRALHGLPASF